jgi:predicted nucleic acid-binding protein
VILVDTSAWIELLRATGHPAHVTLRHHLERRSPIATSEPIIMELLAGTRGVAERTKLRARLVALPDLDAREKLTTYA